MSNNYEEMIKKELQKMAEKPKPLPNIMLLGETGCGKSSLINCIFGKEVAKVSDVSRGTVDFKKYEGKKYDIGANLIDSRGYELSDGKTDTFDNYIKAVKKEMEKSRSANPFDKIHIIWYCISLTGRVIQEYDIKTIKTLLEDNELKERVCVVLTKCDKDKKDGSISKTLIDVIKEELPIPIKVFCVSNNEKLPFEIEDLVDWSGEQLEDDDMREAFIQSQIISLKAKRTNAGTIIAAYSAAAAAIGAISIPIADAALLTPLQIAMTTHIINSYGFGSIEGIIKNVVGAIIIPTLGKNLVKSLIKMLPGLGAIIDAGVAFTFTAALGCAVSQICFMCCEKIAKGETVDFEQEFGAEAIESGIMSFTDAIKSKGKNSYFSDKKPDKNKVDKIVKEYKKDDEDNKDNEDKEDKKDNKE